MVLDFYFHDKKRNILLNDMTLSVTHCIAISSEGTVKVTVYHLVGLLMKFEIINLKKSVRTAK